MLQRPIILIVLFMLSAPTGLYAEKILCLSDYQGGGGKADTLERLLETIFTAEGRIDTVIVAGDYIKADDLLTAVWMRLGDRAKIAPPDILFARGNHDKADAMVLSFDPSLPSVARASPVHLPEQKPGQITAYARNGLLFVITDPFLSFKRKGYTKRQLDRLEALLSSTKYARAFVVGHLPAFPKFRHVGKSIDHFTYARDRLVRILARHGTHFIYGHDHYANIMRVDASLHIDCGTINGAYGSAAIIDTDGAQLVVRFYEVGAEALQAKTQLVYQYTFEDNPEKGHGLQKVWPADRRYQPDHLWGSNRVPLSRSRYIEMGLMQATLEYLLDWINYFL
jgi:predicted phosphodiesterase